MSPVPKPGKFWRRALWSVLWPPKRHRIAPTVSGTVLIGLSLGIGTAAYNSSSNILFIALSLLLACFIFSGVLAWINLRGIHWRMEVEAPVRAGQPVSAVLTLDNGKAFIPTYALWFEFSLKEPQSAGRPESTFTGKGIDFKAIMAKASEPKASGTAHLRTRLDPGSRATVDWVFEAARRGGHRVCLIGVGSLFPFGFLRKLTGTEVERRIVVWPAPVEYRWASAQASRIPTGDRRLARAGTTGDFIALRRYEPGDSHRLIHWKASARTRRLVVRQFSDEASIAYCLRVRTGADLWSRPEQFELMLGLASTMAEDLFREGRIAAVAVDDEPLHPVRRLSDLEGFLDRIACLQLGQARPDPLSPAARFRSQLTFRPEGPRGVCAYVDGIKAATT